MTDVEKLPYMEKYNADKARFLKEKEVMMGRNIRGGIEDRYRIEAHRRL